MIRKKRVRKPMYGLMLLGLAACGNSTQMPPPAQVKAATLKAPTPAKAATAKSAAPLKTVPRKGTRPEAPHTGSALPSKPPAEALARFKSGLVIPVAGVGTMQLVDTFEEKRGSNRKHAAIDILAPRGAAVLSASGGRIVQLSTNASGGLMVFATDQTGQFMLLYAHLDSYEKDLAVGMPLRAGQVLGAVGTSGNAPPNTPHLHFAIAWSPGSLRWSRGLPLDPLPLLVPPVLARSG